ncbi:MAG: bifunctional hydroxymethylpyrimidine kinase/phosphomethylpyrimidine kinase [Burkholderiaceae bacterium]
MSEKIPNVLSIAGVDPSGGAGIFADLKTFSALGAYGCGVVTALTAQNTRAVEGVMLVDPAFVQQQMRTLFADVRIDAIKIGMLGAVPLIEGVAEALRRFAPGVPVVLDPVMVAKSGDPLLAEDAVDALRSTLLPLATLITPNLPEAGVLLGGAAPASLDEMRIALPRLRAMMAPGAGHWVMLKGGHLDDRADDLLGDGDTVIELPGRRVPTRNTHGTGCSLSAAIAALLPRAENLPDAVRQAKQWLSGAIEHADDLSVGEGHGPVHHFHELWGQY